MTSHENPVKITRALLSVSDKTGLEKLAHTLHRLGVEILASGGTADLLRREQIPLTAVETFTGNPEAFDGRMKTLSFKLESAILYDRFDGKHVQEAEQLGIPPIDLVVCNFYPFEKAVARGGTWDDLIHNVDVGGPTMVRAAAKNHGSVAVVVDPRDYDTLIEELENRQGQVSAALRRDLMVKAFQYARDYDEVIFQEFSRRAGHSVTLRYGENPHQKAYFEKSWQPEAIDWSLVDGQGLELSYNNILDAQAAFGTMRDAWRCGKKLLGSREFMAVSIVKHQNPCGLALAFDDATAFERAWAGDPVSSFGGVIAFSGRLTKAAAEKFESKFVEVVLAPEYEPAALEILRRKKKKLRLLRINRLDLVPPPVVMRVEGGMLRQDPDDSLDEEFQTVTKKGFPSELLGAARFGVVAAKWIKSNAIALVRSCDEGGFQLVGMGSGQPNRVDAVRRLALPKAREALAAQGENAAREFERLVLVSDAFFPFPDNIEEAHSGGVRFIVQPGGSVKDADVITACDRLGVAMVMTGKRHFRH